MGFAREKYTRDYFLGSIDPATGKQYGVAGCESFLKGQIDGRYYRALRAALQVLGSVQGKAVLDVGCGRGDLEKLIVPLGPAKLVAIDFSPAAVEICRTVVHHPSLHVFEMEAKDICWPGEFDLVFMLDVVEHIPVQEINAVMNQVRTCLRRDGLIVIHTPLFRSRDAVDGSDLTPCTSGMHCNKQTFGSLSTLLSQHGLTPVTVVDGTWLVRRAQDVRLVERALLWFSVRRLGVRLALSRFARRALSAIRRTHSLVARLLARIRVH